MDANVKGLGRVVCCFLSVTFVLAVFSPAPVSAALIEDSPGNWVFNTDPPNPVVDPLIATGGDLITFLAGSGLLTDVQFVEANIGYPAEPLGSLTVRDNGYTINLEAGSYIFNEADVDWPSGDPTEYVPWPTDGGGIGLAILGYGNVNLLANDPINELVDEYDMPIDISMIFGSRNAINITGSMDGIDVGTSNVNNFGVVLGVENGMGLGNYGFKNVFVVNNHGLIEGDAFDHDLDILYMHHGKGITVINPDQGTEINNQPGAVIHGTWAGIGLERDRSVDSDDPEYLDDVQARIVNEGIIGSYNQIPIWDVAYDDPMESRFGIWLDWDVTGQIDNTGQIIGYKYGIYGEKDSHIVIDNAGTIAGVALDPDDSDSMGYAYQQYGVGDDPGDPAAGFQVGVVSQGGQLTIDDNTGTIIGTDIGVALIPWTDGVDTVFSSGLINNSPGGVIEGGMAGIYAEHALVEIINAGRIEGTDFDDGSDPRGFGVYVDQAQAGSEITNVAGGTITGEFVGLLIEESSDNVSVVNQHEATIEGAIAGLAFLDSVADIDNAGLITGLEGVYGSGGGTVVNQETGVIEGTDYGIVTESVAINIDNYGTIASPNEAIRLEAGGTIDNQTDGVIIGQERAIRGLDGVVTIGNYGTIESPERAIWLDSGGTVTNYSGAFISGDEYAIYSSEAGGSVTITNYGNVESNDRYGINIRDGGTIDNHGSIVAGRNAISASGDSLFLTNYSGAHIEGADNRSAIRWYTDNGTILNQGTITGGEGIYVGNFRTIDSLVNEGDIIAVEHAIYGDVYDQDGVITEIINSGNIIGGYGADPGDHSYAIYMMNDGTITNSGLIESQRYAIMMRDGGEIHNEAGGIIDGYQTGMSLQPFGDFGVDAYTVTNAGTIRSDSWAVAGGSAHLTNTGLIESSYVAIGLDPNSTVINQLGAEIIGSIQLGANGTVENRGDITGLTEAWGVEAGVVLWQDGTVTNDSDGTIGSNDTGIYLGNGGTITNAGTIEYGQIGIHVNQGTADITHSGAFVQAGAGSDAILFDEDAVDGTVTLNAGLDGDIRHLGDSAGASLSLQDIPTGSAGNIQFGSGAVTQHGGTWTIESLIAGVFDINGGTAILSGQGSASDTLTTVNSGTLQLNDAWHGGDVDVHGRLTGTGTIGGDLSIEDGGTFAPGNSIGVINIDGDFTLATNASLEIDAQIEPTLDSDRLNVGGSATLADGSIILVDQFGPGEFIGDGSEVFSIIQTGAGVSDNGVIINSAIPSIRFNGIVDGNNYNLVANVIDKIIWDGLTGNWSDPDRWDTGEALPTDVDGAVLELRSVGVAAESNADAVGGYTNLGGIEITGDISHSITGQSLTFADGAAIANLTTNGGQDAYIYNELIAGAGGLILNSANGDIHIDGNIDLSSGGNLTTTAGDTLATRINGSINGIGSLIATGDGQLHLNAANTYSGGTTLMGGTVYLNDSDALGTGDVNAVNDITLVPTVSIANNFNIGSDAEMLIDTGSNITLSGDISGAGAFAKTHGNELTISGNNTYTGGTTVFNGRLKLGAAEALPEGGSVHIAMGELDINNYNVSVAGFTGHDGGYVNLGTGDLTILPGNTFWSGVIFGDGDVILDGTGDEFGASGVFLNANTYTGDTILRNATLNLVESGLTAGSVAGDIVLETGSVIFERDTDWSYDGVISGDGSIQKYGSGILTLGGDNTYENYTILHDGGVIATNDNSFGTSVVDIWSNASVSAGTFGINLANDFEISWLDPDVNLTINGTNDFEISGDISGPGGLIKDGAHILTLSGANTFTGLTQILEGTLIGSLAGAVDISAGASYQSTSDYTVGALLGSGDIMIDGGQSFTTDTEDDSEFDGNFFGDSTTEFLKSGQGRLTLTADNSAFEGNTRINGGFLNLAGTLGGTVDVEDGGTLMGTGTVAGNLFSRSGSRVSPGNSIGTLTIAGDWQIDPGAIIAIDIDAGTDNCDLIDVTGDVDIQGGTVEVTDLSGASVVDGTTYTFLTHAGTRAGEFDSIVSLSPFYDFDLFYDDPASVYFQAIRLASDHKSSAVTRNQWQIANAIDKGTEQLELGGLMDLGPDVPAALDDLSPEPYRVNRLAAFGQAQTMARRWTAQARRGSAAYGMVSPMDYLVQNEVSHRTLSDHASSADRNTAVAGRSAQQQQQQQGAFFQPFGQYGQQDSGTGRTGFRYRSGGFTAGLDYGSADDIIQGIGIGYTHTRIDFKESRGDSKIDSLRVGPYMSYTHGDWMIDASLSGAVHWFDATRKIPQLSLEADSDHRGYDISAYLGASVNMDYDQWILAPGASLQYTHLWQRGFTESGAGAANLRIDSQRNHSLRSLLGITAIGTEDFIWADVRPTLFAGWGFEMLDDDTTVDGRFAASGVSTFRVDTEGQGRHSGIFGAGLNFDINPDTDAYISYQAEIMNNADYHTLMGGLSIRF